VSKLLNVFTFNVQMMDYQTFYLQVTDLFLRPTAISPLEHLARLRQFAFSIYDMNLDHGIDMADLFSFMKGKY
jgi:hypothetical protein